MIALLISLIAAAVGVTVCVVLNASPEGTVWAGIGGFLIAQLAVGMVVRRKTKAVQDQLQGILMAGQAKMNRMVQQFQTRPGGNVKAMQRQLEKGQQELVTEALSFVDRFEPFKKWNLFMGRQIATMRMQFLYQLKDFEKVDEILGAGGMFSGPMMMEPMAVAMKMARQYKNEQFDALEKTFKRHLIWFRGDRSKLLYGLMSWAYMKQGEVEKARQLLIKGKEATGNETLAHNLEMLTNNKPKHFSNAGFGEEWYGLYLENPPPPKQQRVRGGRGGRPF